MFLVLVFNVLYLSYVGSTHHSEKGHSYLSTYLKIISAHLGKYSGYQDKVKMFQWFMSALTKSVDSVLEAMQMQPGSPLYMKFKIFY